MAEATLQRDRILKKRLYARAGVPLYWILALQERRFEVYSDPSGSVDPPDYRHRQDFRALDALPVVLDGVEVSRIPVQELLP